MTEKYEKCSELESLLRNESLKTGQEPWRRYNGRRLFDLLKVREMDMETLLSMAGIQGKWSPEVLESVAIEAKYDGYIARALADIRKFKKMEEMHLPSSFDYAAIKGLTTEAAEKLNRYRPSSVGMASRISGISPADISVLIIYFSRKEEK